MKRHQLTLKDLAAMIGEPVLVRWTPSPGNEILVECSVCDAKQAYGATRVLVAPVAGRGQAWIEMARIVLDENYDTNIKRRRAQI